jgi:ribonucleoside-diphosphate reductase alpha chain
MQAMWQKHIDASISSTINLPKGTSLEEAEDLYMYAWEMGLKGCTIYVDGCKRSGILTFDDEESEIVATTESEEPVKATGYYATCPECQGEQMVVANGCVTCMDCGFSPC